MEKKVQPVLWAEAVLLAVDLGQFGKKAASVLEVCSTVFMPLF